ncbi:nitrate- and nitrite sensing domain-containing protein [Streptomyces decoyicus]|uniref:nitrate- and nitrite sensing domain-containing protein n=1 Tax=Streptomyces decoyicus TaxID=249567 RepID=UPI00069FABCA|nr:nitrate- and nitrite sensing domain-containing protein [Streptomyces decoyicus]KOG40148.1 histidine kinase [Streptomyces decoyicus]QZY14584.1 nitrate- and nitrite sensing domain-containing protein [Streptomyces decoyicus]
MRFRGKSVRRKIVALLLVPLVSLMSMWAFMTYITGREANQLLDVGNVVKNLGYPVEDVIQTLQRERRQSLLYLADRRGADALDELHRRTRATDEAVSRLRADIDLRDIREDLSEDTGDRMTGVLKGLGALGSLRAQVEDNTVSRDEAMESYNALVDPGYDFLAALHALENVEMDKQARALVNVTRAREAVSREDALMSAVLASGSMSKRDLRALSDRVAERRVLYRTNLPALPAKDRGLYADYWHSAKARELTSYEDRVIAAGPQAGPRAVNAERWNTTARKVLDDLQRMGKDAGDRYQERVAPVAMNVLLKAAIAGVLGFAALLVSLIVSFRIGRRHVRDLIRLRKAAHDVSGVRLPSVMRRLAAGEQVDVETEAPRLEFGPDETGQVGQALHTLQRAAIEAAVKQAEMRRGVSEVFVNLARRSQVLLHRQLTLLDAMERRTEDTDELADLFRIDHLTTRMRRHAEGLVILSGAAPSRQWRKPIQLMDVVRAAVAEVEDYERIEVRRLPRLAVDGPAVSDLTHLIAELLENATVFSPPHTAVQVLGERVANGFTLEIHDRGLGMTPDLLLEANLRLAETPEFELSDTDRLGLFVVSRLAQRQDVRVSLQPSPYGGTTAVVFIPARILTESTAGGREDDDPAPDGLPGGPVGNELEHAAGKLAALSQAPPRRERRIPAVIDGPVELEAPLGPDELAPDGLGPDGLGPADDEDALFRKRDRDRERKGPAPAPDGPAAAPRAIAPVPPVPEGEQHQQTRDQAPGGPAPLPRRRPRPPVLVADHGRTVDDRGAQEQRAAERPGSERPGSERPGSGRPRPEGSEARPSSSAAPEPPGPALDGTQPTKDRERPAPTTPTGLPRRVRQASLAPQLKAEATGQTEVQGRSTEAEDDRDAEAVRARMASLQRGWQRGRRDNGEDPRATAPPRGQTPAAGETAAAGGTAPDPTGPDTTDPDARATATQDGHDTGSTAPPGTTSGGDGP